MLLNWTGVNNSLFWSRCWLTLSLESPLFLFGHVASFIFMYPSLKILQKGTCIITLTGPNFIIHSQNKMYANVWDWPLSLYIELKNYFTCSLVKIVRWYNAFVAGEMPQIELRCVSMPGKGRGMVSSCDISPGSLVHAEEPYAMVRNNYFSQ